MYGEVQRGKNEIKHHQSFLQEDQSLMASSRILHNKRRSIPDEQDAMFDLIFTINESFFHTAYPFGGKYNVIQKSKRSLQLHDIQTQS